MIKTQKINGIEVFSCHPARNSGRPPLLFVHGAFAGGWMWTDTFMPYLAQAGYPCHALSLRGHGGSDGHEHIDWLSIADYVDDVVAVIDWLGDAPVLIGHSMGGFVIQKYLERHTVPGVALLCSVPPQGLIAAQFHMLFQKPHLFMDLNSIMGGDHADSQTLREALFAGEVDEDDAGSLDGTHAVRVAPGAVGHVDVQPAQPACDESSADAHSGSRARRSGAGFPGPVNRSKLRVAGAYLSRYGPCRDP